MTGTIHVFESVKGPDSVVKYIDQVVRYAPENISFTYFSWKNALFNNFDVFHVHFPESLLRSPSIIKRQIKRLLFYFFLVRLKQKSTPIVRTVHNIEPHDRGTISEQKLLKRLDRLVSHRVILNECTPKDWNTPTTLIPHGDFREQMTDFQRKKPEIGRILLFGRLRPYKGALELIRTVKAEKTGALELRVVGSPTDSLKAQIKEELSAHTTGETRISTELRTVSDSAMVAEMTAAELVVIPNQDLAQSNSGVALMALSLNRPVLIQKVCMTESLSRETGPGWVHFFVESLDAKSINKALESSRTLIQQQSPNFLNRDWQFVATSYAEVFEQLNMK